MTVVRSGGRGGVAAETPEEPARRESGDRGGAPNPPPPGEAQTYRVSLPKRLLQLRSPVEGCLGGASNRTNLWVHFAHRQAREIIVILDEGNRPYPR